MDFNKLFTLFTQAGLRPGQPADEHNEAGVGIAEIGIDDIRRKPRLSVQPVCPDLTGS